MRIQRYPKINPRVVGEVGEPGQAQAHPPAVNASADSPISLALAAAGRRRWLARWSG